MRWSILVSLAVLFLCALPVAAQSAKAAGTWDVTLSSPQGTFNVQLILKQDGDKVSGVVKSPRGEVPIEGTTTAKNINLKYTIKYQENDLLITLTGAIDDSSIKGTADYGGFATGDFDAKRASETAAPPTTTAAPANKIDLTGSWAIQVESAAGTGSPTFIFKQEGEKLSGQYKGAFGEAPVTGTLKENKIEFTIKVDVQGQPVTVNYSGTVENDRSMKGTVTLGNLGSGTWTGKRQ